eukprot:scaffold437_cov168-Ochromonas_danica.AAC.54
MAPLVVESLQLLQGQSPRALCRASRATRATRASTVRLGGGELEGEHHHRQLATARERWKLQGVAPALHDEVRGARELPSPSEEVEVDDAQQPTLPPLLLLLPHLPLVHLLPSPFQPAFTSFWRTLAHA